MVASPNKPRRGRGPSKIPLRDRPDGYFAANLTMLLARRRMEASDLAERLGEDARRVRRLADGTTLPHYNEIPRIAREMEVSAADLAWTPTDRLRVRLGVSS
jgi:transcriptional regulator with XRE-family HTH domain